MRTPKGKRYCSDEAELDQYRLGLKLECCPHCGAVGWLICHGFLRGYGHGSAEQVIRGRRFFCSNRNRRQGCGRTFAVLLARFLRGCMVPARMLWAFLQQVRGGQSRKRAWEEMGQPFAIETAYRWWKRMRQKQPALRVRLRCLGCPPATNATEPLYQLIDHLQAVFPRADNPIEALQTRLQRSFPG